VLHALLVALTNIEYQNQIKGAIHSSPRGLIAAAIIEQSVAAIDALLGRDQLEDFT